MTLGFLLFVLVWSVSYKIRILQNAALWLRMKHEPEPEPKTMQRVSRTKHPPNSPDPLSALAQSIIIIVILIINHD